jgi:hypothetical protein
MTETRKGVATVNKGKYVGVRIESPCHDGIWGNGGIVPTILKLGSR